MNRDPVNDMSVKEYNAMLIEDKKEQLAGARNHLIKTMGTIEDLERELIALILESVNGYKLPTATYPKEDK